MFSTAITTKEEALCHLFLYCCYKDGDFNEKELDFVSGLFVELDLHSSLNFKNEMLKYKNYRATITDEVEYLNFLIKLINPVHDCALYSYCAEVLLSDSLLELQEEKLLEHLAQVLEIPAEKEQTIRSLITQRKAVELGKLF